MPRILLARPPIFLLTVIAPELLPLLLALPLMLFPREGLLLMLLDPFAEFLLVKLLVIMALLVVSTASAAVSESPRAPSTPRLDNAKNRRRSVFEFSFFASAATREERGTRGATGVDVAVKGDASSRGCIMSSEEVEVGSGLEGSEVEKEYE